MGFDHVKLEKGMYRESGKTFTQVLESLDPSENYRGTALEGTDAFQRQLKRFDIHAKGAYSDPVEKFFRTMDSSVLFPEYIARAVKQGMEENNVLPKITASTTSIDAMDYRSVYSVPSEQDKMLMQVAEGASIPATQVKTKDNLVKLNKRGRMLVASYAPNCHLHAPVAGAQPLVPQALSQVLRRVLVGAQPRRGRTGRVPLPLRRRADRPSQGHHRPAGQL